MDEALLLVSVAFGAIDAKLRDESLGELSSIASMMESVIDLGNSRGRDSDGFEEIELEEVSDGSLPPVGSMKKFKTFSNL